jgi:hypothetical protein
MNIMRKNMQNFSEELLKSVEKWWVRGKGLKEIIQRD